MEYRRASGVAEVASDIIKAEHPHLLGVRVTFVFVDKAPKSKGKDVWARAKKISGLNAFLSAETAAQEHYGECEDYFVIEVWEGAWEHLSEHGRRALIDHELCHCEIERAEDGPARLAIVGHDVTEFEAILSRHGLWHSELEDFGHAAAEQLSLMEDGKATAWAEEGQDRQKVAANAGERDDVKATVTVRGETFDFDDTTVEKIKEGGAHLRALGSESR